MWLVMAEVQALASPRCALLTGASSPIGLALAQTLATEGWNLLLQCHSQQQRLAAEVQRMAHKTGRWLRVCSFDLSDADATESGFRAAVAQLDATSGPLTGLVANAGLNRDGLLVRSGLSKVRHVFDVNLLSVYNLSHLALREMLPQRWGRIVYIGSAAGQAGSAGQAAYAATKSAVEGLARSVAREYGARNITANVVAPGWVETPMSASALSKNREAIVAQIPLERVGTPDDIAAAVAFLCSSKAGYITGQTLHVNGGLVMH